MTLSLFDVEFSTHSLFRYDHNIITKNNTQTREIKWSMCKKEKENGGIRYAIILYELLKLKRKVCDNLK